MNIGLRYEVDKIEKINPYHRIEWKYQRRKKKSALFV